MPFSSTVTQKTLEVKLDAIQKLRWKCEECKHFKGKDPEVAWCFEISDYYDDKYSSENGPAIVAIAKFGDVYAMMTPMYLTEKQMVVWEFVLRMMEEKDEIVVFSQRDFDVISRYNFKRIKVRLYK